ncbi:COG1361 S-layer family protein [Natronomonas sp.]|uniref:COG1361 S-layer family protein n=1 Tax=Natronomonas sp. TaxID=2184060 RepID=UPI00262009A7|nr:NEW3 domain-containing protein [Natronomonas sp.]
MAGSRSTAVVLAALLVVSLGGASVAAGQGIVTGEPRLNVDVPDSTLTPGTATQLDVQISNNGQVDLGSPDERDVVTAARNVRVDAEADGPIEVETERQAIGTVTEGEPQTVSLNVRVPEGADPGEYELDVELEYGYTARIEQGAGVLNDRTRTVTRSVDVEVDDGARFEIEAVEDRSQVGDTGPVTARVENVGNERADEVTVDLSVARDQSRVSFDATSDRIGVGSLAPGEAARFEFETTVSPDASPHGYPIEAVARFEDTDGIESQGVPRRLTVTPEPKQRFSFADVESTLRVGEDGELRGTVTNDGPRPVRSVVVRFADQSPNVVPIEDSVAVGTLSAGESASFELPIALNREAEAIPRNFGMAVAYRNADDERRAYEDIDVTVDVGENRDEFLLAVADRELTAGGSTLVDVEVTNNLDESVTDVEAKLFTDDPLSSDESEGYIESLAPGESATVTFEVSASGGATPRTYALQTDFRYDDADGTSKVSDTYRTAIDVTEAEDGGIPWLGVGVVIVVVVVAAGAFAYRRREG